MPDETFIPDLIIIATKLQGLEDAIKNIKNFVNENKFESRNIGTI